jgi:hypothetical protein
MTLISGMTKVVLWNLKVYWEQERNQVEQKDVNQVLDCILTKDYSHFTQCNIQRMIEFGDYLFVCLEQDIPIAFAIGVDRPSSAYDIWSPSFAERHGSFHIELVVSFVKGYGRPVLAFIEQFARDTLNREQLDLLALDVPKLIHYYKACGFHLRTSPTKDTYKTRFMYKRLQDAPNREKNKSTRLKTRPKKLSFYQL